MVAVDGKIVESYAQKNNKINKVDGRRDIDADCTVKQYTTNLSNREVSYVDNIQKSHRLTYLGYDKKTNSLRYGFNIQDRELKEIKQNRVFTIDIDEEPRVFTPIARDSMKWKRLYNARTAVERYNGRLDRDLGFDKYTIRGYKKM